MRLLAVLFFLSSSAYADQRTRGMICAPLLSHSEGTWADAYLNLLNIVLEGIEEIESHAFGHADRAEIKSNFLQTISSSSQIINPLSERQILTNFSPKLSTLADSGQFEDITENLNDKDWQHIRQAAQQKLIQLQEIQTAQVTARPAAQEDFEDTPDKNGNNRLLRAILARQFDQARAIVTSLQNHKRYLNHRNSHGHSAFSVLEGADFALHSLLEEYGALFHTDLNKLDFELLNATEMNDIVEVERLYNLGADVNALVTSGIYYSTPIAMAISKNSPQAIRTLIKLGADVDFKNYVYYSALLLALDLSSSFETFAALLEANPELEKTDSPSGYTAFSLAVKSARIDVIELLATKGAKVLIGRLGAIELNAQEIPKPRATIETLVKINFDLNTPLFPHDQALLHMAVRGRLFDLVDALLKNGANPRLPSRAGTPMDINDKLRSENTSIHGQMTKLLESYINKEAKP